MSSWITEITGKRRDKLCILAEILEIAKGGTLKTQIMYKANLSFKQLNGYLSFMLKVHLLEKIASQSKDIYVATAKGLDFLQLQCELTDFLKSEKEKPRNKVETPPMYLFRNV